MKRYSAPSVVSLGNAATMTNACKCREPYNEANGLSTTLQVVDL